jgi:hypothetical protein
MRCLNVIGMIVPICRSHTFGDYVVRHNVSAVCEGLAANPAFLALLHDWRNRERFRCMPSAVSGTKQSGKGTVPGTGWPYSRETNSCADPRKPAGNPEDHQARYIEAAVHGFLITSIYLANGNPQPGPKFN